MIPNVILNPQSDMAGQSVFFLQISDEANELTGYEQSKMAYLETEVF